MEYLEDGKYETRIHTYVVEVIIKGTPIQFVFSEVPSTPTNENELKYEAVKRLNNSGLFKTREDGYFIGFEESDITIVEDLIYNPNGKSPKGNCVHVARPRTTDTGRGYFTNLCNDSSQAMASATKGEKKIAREAAKTEKIEKYKQAKKAEQDAIDAGTPLPPKETSAKIAIEVILTNVIEHFSEPRKMTEAAKALNLQYQKVRYALMLVKDKGFKGNKYDLIESIIDDCKAFVLKKRD